MSGALATTSKAVAAAALLPKADAGEIVKATQSVCAPQYDVVFRMWDNNYNLKWMVFVIMLLTALVTFILTALGCIYYHKTPRAVTTIPARTTKRTVKTQSQVNYQRWKNTPKFQPLGERDHGVWEE